ncbi:hypothetical protein HPB52_008439 [Rhipicephalus sanguineus]|uniref:Uncharacterized protein n=1 Tax=Rhipicephalus sanguineus TaxID=34632 RepID=A0A9D4SW96_RHISA|nr:hypothetical protein HPB52_008439 [Rhipicephalus sanguineus]
MEATRYWVAVIPGLLTVASLIGILYVWRFRSVRSSSGVPFLPMATAIICLYFWLLCCCAAGDTKATLASDIGITVVVINAMVRRAISHDTGPRWRLVVTLLVMYIVSPPMSLAWLWEMTFRWTVACNLAPISRILILPRPEIGLLTGTVCGLWALHAGLAGDVPQLLRNLVGTAIVALGSSMLPVDSFRRQLQ